MTIKIILDTETKKIIEYSTRDEYEIDAKLKNKDGLRVLHPDFINNDESQGHHVTYVKGLDDPDNAPELVEERRLQKIDSDRIKLLKEKSRNNTLSQQDKDEITKRMVDML